MYYGMKKMYNGMKKMYTGIKKMYFHDKTQNSAIGG